MVALMGFEPTLTDRKSVVLHVTPQGHLLMATTKNLNLQQPDP